MDVMNIRIAAHSDIVTFDICLIIPIYLSLMLRSVLCVRLQNTRDWSLYLLDCAFSVGVVGTLVVFVWRGVWILIDIYLFPENPGYSAVGSLVNISLYQRYPALPIADSTVFHYIFIYVTVLYFSHTPTPMCFLQIKRHIPKFHILFYFFYLFFIPESCHIRFVSSSYSFQ